jgi:hypothetical protein
MRTGGRAAAVTNEIRREKRALFEQERINRELAEMFARHEARKRRKREKQRARRTELRARARVEKYPPYPTY